MRIEVLIFLTVCSFSLIQPAQAWFNFAPLNEMYTRIRDKIDQKTGIFFLWNAVSKKTETWQCGNVETKITLKAAYQLGKPECTADKITLAVACKEHDKCYAKREGREKCDQQFCTDVYNIRKNGTCNLSAHAFCSAIEEFGSNAYDDDPQLTVHFRNDQARRNATTTL